MPDGTSRTHGADVIDHIGADAHSLGQADEDGGLPGTAGREELGLLAVCAGLVDEPRLLHGEPAYDELAAWLVVQAAPLAARGPEAADDDLQRARCIAPGAVAARELVVLVRARWRQRCQPCKGEADA